VVFFGGRYEPLDHSQPHPLWFDILRQAQYRSHHLRHDGFPLRKVRRPSLCYPLPYLPPGRGKEGPAAAGPGLYIRGQPSGGGLRRPQVRVRLTCPVYSSPPGYVTSMFVRPPSGLTMTSTRPRTPRIFPSKNQSLAKQGRPPMRGGHNSKEHHP